MGSLNYVTFLQRDIQQKQLKYILWFSFEIGEFTKHSGKFLIFCFVFFSFNLLLFMGVKNMGLSILLQTPPLPGPKSRMRKEEG